MVRRIVTHHGAFHADDVFGCAVLRALFPEAELVRTRAPERLRAAQADSSTAVVDVGDRQDDAALHFDHHQAGFALQRRCGTPYAAFGLVWRRFGASWVRLRLAVSDAEATQVAELLDDSVIRSVDAVDNGAVRWLSEPAGAPAPLHVSRLIDHMNPSPPAELGAYDAAFEEAMRWAAGVLVRAAGDALRTVRAAAIVAGADDGGAVLALPEACDWEPHAQPHHLYVVYRGDHDGDWRVQCVPTRERGHTPRRPLPAQWAGLRDAELRRVSGVADAVFCHRARFIAGAESCAGALALASAALAAVDRPR